MKKQDCSGVLRGTIRRQIKAVNAYALAVETDFLALDTQVRNAQIDARARLEYDAVHEPSQHEIAEQHNE